MFNTQMSNIVYMRNNITKSRKKKTSWEKTQDMCDTQSRNILRKWSESLNQSKTYLLNKNTQTFRREKM